MVVVVKAHLKIKAHKLCHVAVSVGVLRTENGSNFKHPLEIRAHRHLLVELRRLSKESLSCKEDEKI